MKRFPVAVLSGLASLAILAPTAAEAAPYLHFNLGGYNPETGNAGRMAGGYNPSSGARYFRAGGYDASTGNFGATSRFYNPSTGQGAALVTEGVRGSGFTSTINTLQNGSYSCSASVSQPFNCVQTDNSF
jgi:hypothetical protein